MTPEELKNFRNRFHVSFLELAAKTGLTHSYLEKIEEKSIVALAGDWKKIRLAAASIIEERFEEPKESES